MMKLLLITTLICLLIPVYVYAGYPLILWVLTRFKPSLQIEQRDDYPSVTLIVSCYNEADVIREKLQNCLALDYPPESIEFIVVSDGSEDSTDEVVQEFSGQGVRLLRQEGRLGKTIGLNMALTHVTSEIVVFSDANAMYSADAIKRLTGHFANDSVGYVVGAALYTDGGSGGSAHSEGLYWRYELAIKQMESNLHSVVGGDGAMYAIRTKLWEPLQQLSLIHI